MPTVLVTRPADQAAQFVRLLEKQGLIPVLFPTIEIRPLPGWTVPDLIGFDGVFFTSTNSITHFIDRLMQEAPDQLDRLAVTDVWAVGKQSASELGRYGITTRPLAKIGDAVTMMEEIGAEAISGHTFLFVRGNLSLGTVPELILRYGGTCTELTVYENCPPPLEKTNAVKKQVLDGKIDCLSFTSPSTAENFFTAMGSTALPPGTKVAAIGTTTARALEKLGVKVDIIPETFDSPGFAQAIAKALLPATT